MRAGLTIGRLTLTASVGATGVALAPLVEAMRRDLMSRPVLHADEMPVAMLDPGAGKTHRACPPSASRRPQNGSLPWLAPE